MALDSLVQIFGGAGATFYVMWLWLNSVREEKKKLEVKLDLTEKKRILELKEMLPLLIDTSKGLQEVIESNTKKDNEVVNELKTHIDEVVSEITELCRKN